MDLRSNFARLAAAILALLSAPATHAEETLTTLRIAAVSGSVMPQDFRAGIAQGIFAKHGLKLEIAELATGTNNITAAVNGSADIAYADVFAGLSSIKNGFDIGFVAPHNGISPSQFILVRSDSDIRSIKDLSGKNIALGAPPQFKAITSSLLKAQGGDPTAVKFTIVPDQTTFGAVLQSKQADAIATSSAVNAYKWIDQFKFRTVGAVDTRSLNLADGSPIAGWWATRDWYQKHEDLARRFSDALRETIRWYATLPKEKRVEIVKTQTGIDLVALDKETSGVLDAATEYFGFGTPVDLKKLAVWVEIGAQYAKVPNDVDLDKHVFPTAKN
jgi:ABC-type nitrate/sulfonate/bicarbonate transport system substrate-binding protein